MKEGIKLDGLETLPPVIKSLLEGWSIAFQNSAAVSALFAGVSSQLYSFFTDVNDNYGHRHSPPAAITFMILLSYASMLFNAGAAMSSFVLVDTLSELPYLNARVGSPGYPIGATVHEGPMFLIRRYGAGRRWSFALYHWLFCYMAGMWCLILQITTYVLMQEPDVIRIPITILAGFIVLPLISYVIPRSRPDNVQVRDSGFFDGQVNASNARLNGDNPVMREGVMH